MPKKLLKKSRNRHLQLAENLIPNKTIKRKAFAFKYKPVNNVIEQEICNQWVFSWNTFNKLKGAEGNATKKFAHSKSSLKLSIVSGLAIQRAQPTVKPEIILQAVLPDVGGIGKIPTENDIIHLAKHSLDSCTNQVVGGNLLGSLNRYVHQQYQFNGKKVKGTDIQTPVQSINCVDNSLQCKENGKKQLSRQGRGVILGEHSLTKSTNQKVANYIGNAYVQTDFSIKWDAQFPSVADYLKVQGKKMYSFDEIQRGRDRIGDLRKRQYMERRKISILYGNLPKRTLVRVMRGVLHTSGKVGAINERFLSALETRLDVVLKRLFFFPTIGSARQWIRQGKILVNNCTCTSAGFLLQPGDFVALSKQARTAWKSFWCINAGKGKISNEKASAIEQTGLSTRRRYPLSPLLMRKLQKWSHLWGGLLLQEAAKQDQGLHKWTKLSDIFRRKKSMHPFFVSSCLNHYLRRNPIIEGTPFLANQGLLGISKERNKPLVARRRETKCTNWLKNSTIMSQLPYGNPRKQASDTKSAKQEKTTPWVAGPSQQERGHSRKRQLFRRKMLAAMLLHREASHVVDGLYSYRWNQLLSLKKSLREKKQGWQFSFSKPIHLECCYKQATAIFLYAPQKLIWPCSINASLLKQDLVG